MDKLTFKEKIAFRFMFNERRVYQRWYGRFFLFEMDYGRLVRVVSRISDWRYWCKEWEKEGDSVIKMADTEIENNNFISANCLYHQAVGCYHIGQHFFFIDPHHKETVQEKAREAYKKAINLYPEKTKPIRIDIPFKDVAVPCYMHLCGQKDAPLIIQTNGMDNIKEAENHYFAKHLTKHGFNFLAFDGPGQGELWKDRKFDVKEYPEVVSTIIDWIECHNEYCIDKSRIGLFGYSLGGFLAPYSAAFDKRVKCVVANSGWGDIQGYFGVNKMKLHKRGVLHMTGCHDLQEASIKFDLNINSAPRLDVPMLYFHAGKDAVIENPRQQARIVMEWTKGEKELRFYEDAEHCTVNYLDEVLPYSIDWLLRTLNVSKI